MSGRIYDENFARIRPNAPPGLDRAANPFRFITIPLDTALDLNDVAIQGTFVWAVTASSKTAVMNIRFNDQIGEGLPVKEGMFLAGLSYNRIYVTADAQAGEYITLMYGVETRDVRVVNPGAQFSDVELIKPTTFDGVADVEMAATAVTTILAADSTRRSATITNLSGNAETLRIGGTGTAAAAQGTPLAPGQSMTIEGTDAIVGYNPGAGTQDVAISVVRD